MKLFVQGRKDGYFSYPKPEPLEFNGFGGDLRPITDQNILGKYVYTIAFVSTGCVFTKVTIVEDVQRQYRGYIGFSIFVSNKSKLHGSVVSEIIDKLSETFCKNYCPDYYLDNKQVDWAIFETIANQYDSQMHNLSGDDIENYQRGSADAAFVYYIDKTELCKFFDNPYQEEYSKYKQVFFVEKNLEGKSDNPLNAIPHDPSANLTGKIHSEILKYKLIYNQHATGGVSIEVKVDGRLQYSKNKISKNDKLEIIWSKQYHTDIYKTGTWDEIGSDFLDINNDKKVITVKEKKPDPIKYTLSFQTNPKLDEDIKIKIGNNPEQTIKGHSFTITAEQLYSKCYVSVKNDLYILPTRREIKREDTEVDVITLDLSKYKKVKFIVKGENGVVVKDCSISIFKKEVNKDNEVLFIGDEIKETWQISVSHRDYETEPFNYCPADDDNPKYVILKKKTFSGQGQSPNRKKYYIKIDEEKGNRSYKKGSSISTIPDYEFNKPEYECDSKYGYKFDYWNEPNSIYDACYEAIFKELWYRKVPKLAWVFMIVVFMASTVYFIVYLTGKRSDPTSLETLANTQVNSYIEGIELNLDTLKEYKRKYCDSSIIVQGDVKEKSWWQELWIFGSDDNSSSTTELSDTPDLCAKIDKAIAIRTAINFGKIDELKRQYFSELQQNFKNTIDSIDVKYNKQIGDTLKERKVSLMNLDQVAKLIKTTQKDLREKEALIQKEKASEKSTTPEKQNFPKIKEVPKSNNVNQQTTPIQKQQPSVNSLDKEFWDLVHSGNAQMEAYSNLLKKHKNKGGDIIAYLNKICKNSDTFKKFKNIPEMDRKSAKTLTEININ